MAHSWNKKANATEYLCRSTYVDQGYWRRKIGRHDLQVEIRSNEVQTSSEDEENSEDDPAYQ